jgi:hypothetical protein
MHRRAGRLRRESSDCQQRRLEKSATEEPRRIGTPQRQHKRYEMVFQSLWISVGCEWQSPPNYIVDGENILQRADKPTLTRRNLCRTQPQRFLVTRLASMTCTLWASGGRNRMLQNYCSILSGFDHNARSRAHRTPCTRMALSNSDIRRTSVKSLHRLEIPPPHGRRPRNGVEDP